MTDVAAAQARPVREDIALSVDDLHVEFYTEHGWVEVVDGVSFDLARGETLGLVGESGSGKSVTSMAIMGLIPSPPGRVSGGSVVLGGTDLISLPRRELEDRRGDDIAMIFQEPMSSLNPAFTIGDQIAEVVRRHRNASRRAANARAVEVLELVGIPAARRRLGSYPHEFSGGMRQRVVAAMALACEPDVLIADEPTTALDVTIQAQILDLFRSLQAELGMAILFITHDLGVVADICDRVAVMYAGEIVEEGGVDQMFATPQHPYTRALLASMPQVGSRNARLSSIPGAPPEPWAIPTGCRFEPRCEFALGACRSAAVTLERSGLDRSVRCVRWHELRNLNP
jgi:oligopeptide/dipeptide ABC transporter ATP-binding protein